MLLTFFLPSINKMMTGGNGEKTWNDLAFESMKKRKSKRSQSSDGEEARQRFTKDEWEYDGKTNESPSCISPHDQQYFPGELENGK